jgi:hypothetical protein
MYYRGVVKSCMTYTITVSISGTPAIASSKFSAPASLADSKANCN